MVTFDENTEVYLYPNEVSFRLGIQGLTTIIYESFHKKSFENSIFLFFSKDRKSLKIIEIDDSGTWMYVRRLSKAKYISPQVQSKQTTIIDVRQLKTILESIQEIHYRRAA